MTNTIKIKGKVFKVGTSYGIRVKKALVDSGVVVEGQEVEVFIDPATFLYTLRSFLEDFSESFYSCQNYLFVGDVLCINRGVRHA